MRLAGLVNFKSNKPTLKEFGFPKNLEFTEFAGKRLEGATKIAGDAKEKGGAALLTYHHFAVKLEHYKNASEGKFNIEKAKEQYDIYMNTLHKLMESETPDPIEFQKIVGLIEVLGELIIKNK